MLLLIDNYDSFTYNLKDYFEQLGETVLVYKNDEIDETTIQQLSFDKIVLSPGPKRPQDAGNLLQIIGFCYTKYPILGVCLGHQALGEFFGAQLNLAAEPKHGKTSQINCNQIGIYQNLPPFFNVCRYHSLILEHLPETLQISATTKQNECMSFNHIRYNITGIQYHPEAILTENGLQILKNWLDLTNQSIFF